MTQQNLLRHSLLASGGSSSERALVAFSGSSNIQAFGSVGETVPTPEQTIDPDVRIWEFGASGFAPYSASGNSNEVNEGSSTPQEWGPEARFAADFRSANPNTPLDIVKVCANGSALNDIGGDDWSPDSTGELFDQIESAISAAKSSIVAEFGGTSRLNAFFWGQGNGDATGSVNAFSYYDNLLNLKAAVESRLGDPLTKFIFMRLLPADAQTYTSTLRAVMTRIQFDSPGIQMVDTDFFGAEADGYHLSVPGITSLGSAMMQAYVGTLPVTPTRFSPLPGDHNSNVVFSNGNLTVSGTGSSNSANQSFRVDTVVHHSKKSYFEIEVTSHNALAQVGFGATPSRTRAWGTVTNSVGYYAGGLVFYNGSMLTTLPSFTAGDTVLIAHDGTTGDVWFGKKEPGQQEVWNGDPVSGAGALVTLPVDGTRQWRFGGTTRRSGDSLTIRTSPVATVPLGFEYDG